MKKVITIFLVLVTFAIPTFAQSTTGKTTKLLPTTQAVMNSVVNNADLMVITGKIVDADSHQPITDAKINLNKFGDELVNAAIDKDGNYALAINKKEIGDQVMITFKIDGYQKYTARCVKKDKPVVDLDLFLSPDDSRASSSAKVSYTLSDDPFNTLVIKF